jgi:hypothetical protein
MDAMPGLRVRVVLLTAMAGLVLAAVPVMAQPQLSPVILDERFDTYIDNVWTGDCATYTFDANQAGFEAVWPPDTVAFPPPSEVNSWQVKNVCATGSRGFSAPVSMLQPKAETSRNVRMLTNEIAAAFPGYTGVNGTLTNPLQLEVYIDADSDSTNWAASQQNILVELTGPGFGGIDDMAPNSDTIVQTDLVTPCSADVCVQTPPNPHSSIAVGIFANLDPATCVNCTNPRRTKYIALFDGEQWWQLSETYPVKGCDEPCTGVGIEVSKRRNKIRVTIYADTITVWSNSSNFGVREKKYIPRKYKGPFNRVAMGLMVLTPTGTEGGTLDDLYVSGGVGENVSYIAEGACCLPGGGCEVLEEGPCTGVGGVWNRGKLCSEIQCSGACCVPGPQVCIDTDPGSCTSQHGRFNGLGSTCAAVGASCEPIPFADADRDEDVDQEDFAVLQNCFSGTVAYTNPACAIFDRDLNGAGDGDVDSDDMAAFEKCATGPGVLFNFDSPATGCVP